MFEITPSSLDEETKGQGSFWKRVGGTARRGGKMRNICRLFSFQRGDTQDGPGLGGHLSTATPSQIVFRPPPFLLFSTTLLAVPYVNPLSPPHTLCRSYLSSWVMAFLWRTLCSDRQARYLQVPSINVFASARARA